MRDTKTMTLHFDEGKLKFSSGHFTIFSKTEREPLHGHNYTLNAEISLRLSEPGITFDYRIVEQKLAALCAQLNWHTLIAQRSPYLTLREDASQYHITFDQDTMSLPKKDVVMMPLDNITLETLSQWFVNELTQDTMFIKKFGVVSIRIITKNGPYHGSESKWEKA